MSLLIKALQKAEQGKNSDDKSTTSNLGSALELTPIEAGVKTGGADDGIASSQPQTTQQAAASMFSAKNNNATSSGSKVPLILAGMGLLLLSLIGGGFYLYLQSLQKPELVMARSAAKPATPPSVANPPAVSPTPVETSTPVQEVKPVEPVPHPAEIFEKPATDDAVKTKKELIAPAEQPQAEPRTKTGRSKQLAFGDPLPASEDAKVKVTRNNPGPGVNPVLLSAYQAFNAGDDVTAQELYRQVLQGDVRNVDALLGMAAIAARQNRSEDALGWYGKVLEVEPRNTVAQVAFVNVLAQTDPVGSESRIKNLLVQQPEAAYLHAALGSIYADQSQWSQAQQAYFQAYHFDPNNAEYAFNLAVSLDQLGKSSLALQYYKNALELLSKSGTTHIDRARLESRIGQLQ